MATMDLNRSEGLSTTAGLVLGMIDLGRGRLTAAVKDLTPEQLAKQPVGFGNSVGTLLLHIATTEVGFSHRLMGKQVPADLAAKFPGHKPGEPLAAPAPGTTVADLLALLDLSRGFVAEALKGLSDADLTRELAMGPDRTATVQWMLGILPGHQMQHYGHIQMVIQHL